MNILLIRVQVILEFALQYFYVLQKNYLKHQAFIIQCWNTDEGEDCDDIINSMLSKVPLKCTLTVFHCLHLLMYYELIWVGISTHMSLSITGHFYFTFYFIKYLWCLNFYLVLLLILMPKFESKLCHLPAAWPTLSAPQKMWIHYYLPHVQTLSTNVYKCRTVLAHSKFYLRCLLWLYSQEKNRHLKFSSSRLPGYFPRLCNILPLYHIFLSHITI